MAIWQMNFYRFGRLYQEKSGNPVLIGVTGALTPGLVSHPELI
jgi:hypothetical protein